MTGSRQRRLVFQTILRGGQGAWPGRAAGSSDPRSQAGEAYKTREGAGRPRTVAEQLTRVPPARSPAQPARGPVGSGLDSPRPHPGGLPEAPGPGPEWANGRGSRRPNLRGSPRYLGRWSVPFCSGPETGKGGLSASHGERNWRNS